MKARWIVLGLVAVVVVLVVRVMRAPTPVTSEPPPDASLVIAIALPEEAGNDGLLEGAQLAVKHINKSGGVLGVPLSLVVERASSKRLSGAQGLAETNVARDLALRLADHRPVAVLGHEGWNAAIAASQVYQDRHVLFMAPYPTSDTLTARHFDLVFRMSPRNQKLDGALADYAASRGYCRVLTIQGSGGGGLEHMAYFKNRAEARAIEVTDTIPYPDGTRSFIDMLLFYRDKNSFSTQQPDAIYFEGSPKNMMTFVENARYVGIDKPILSSWQFHKHVNLKASAGISDDTIIYPAADDFGDSPLWEVFFETFKATFGHEPSNMAAIAYDSVTLIADTINRIGRPNSHAIATELHALRYRAPFQGVTGRIAFNLDGDLDTQPVNIVEVQGKTYAVTRWLPTLRTSDGTAALTCKRPAAGMTQRQGSRTKE